MVLSARLRWATLLALCPSVPVLGADCPVQIETRIVAGDSMIELFAPGTAIQVANGWYECHGVERGDIVVVKIAHRPRPIVKLAQVLPRDRFRLVPFREGYRLVVNDEPLKTPRGTPYWFGGQGARMLALYEQTFRGVMPEDTFFVFGTAVGGSLDSSRFGPVKREQLLGRVRL